MLELILYLLPWIKALHIIAVICWMAGIFYLPRLFVYHSENSKPGDDKDLMLQEMERKLLNIIMTPAMIFTWGFGICLALMPGIIDWTAIWPYTKIISIILLTCFHFWLAARQKDFSIGRNIRSGKTYRLMNEIPTALMIIIVISAVIKF